MFLFFLLIFYILILVSYKFLVKDIFKKIMK